MKTFKELYRAVRRVFNKLAYRPFTKRWYKNSKYPSEILKLKGIHDGKRCFIVGNGPSLTIELLDKIAKEYSFATNRIYELFSETKYRPTYYMVSDKDYVSKNFELAKKVTCKKMLIGLQYKNETNKYIEKDNAIFFLKTDRFVNNMPIVAECLENEVNTGHSTLFECAEFALYMGFKEIYFIGCDCNYSDINAVHFYKSEESCIVKGINKPLTVGEKMVTAFGKIGEYGKKHGIKVYNATSGGKLETLPRIDINKILTNERF